MKQNLKYYIIIVLAVLLHSVTMKAANTSYIIEDPDQEECFISESHSCKPEYPGTLSFLLYHYAL
ncbi:hypothetical protein M131_0785 [Bacteroides fragilis str. S6R8]|nr:hypothetical protein [Bacteroides fragilis]EYE57196.1 hypothetical protein M131_0785 [Bacteroides fragilis str. S6R8]